MKSTLTTLFLSLLISSFSNGQNLFQSDFGGAALDALYSIEPIDNNLFLLGGHTSSYGSSGQDFWVLKMDLNGDIQESRTFGTAEREIMRRAFWVDDSYLIAGMTVENNSSNADDDYAVTKRNGQSGANTWTKCWGTLPNDDQLMDATLAADGDLLVCGFTVGGAAASNKGRLIRIAPNGTVKWARTYINVIAEATPNRIYSVKEASGGIVVAGELNDNAFIAKFTHTGSLSWGKSYAETTTSEVEKFIEIVAEEGIVLVENISVTGNDRDILVIRTNSSGTVLWAKKYGGTHLETARFVTKSPDGNILIGGSSTSFGQGEEDGLLFKVNQSTGAVMWATVCGKEKADEYFDAKPFNSGGQQGFLAVGRTKSFKPGDDYDALVVKLDESGHGYGDCICEEAPLQANERTITVTNHIGFNATAYSGEIAHSFSGGDQTVEASIKNPVDTSVLVAGSTLTANADESTHSFQWINCANNVEVGTGKTFTASQSGDYKVVVTNNAGCSDTSVCTNVIGTWTSFSNFGQRAQLFPNPATDRAVLELEGFNPGSSLRVSVFSSQGALQLTREAPTPQSHIELDIANLVPGIYQVLVQSGQVSGYLKLVKI